jgi:plasmid stabilization system protein ParE
VSKKYCIQLLPAARKDLFEMGAYIATDSYEAAIRFLVVDSYLVFYVIQRTAIKIRRIIHGSKDLKSILFH